MLLMYLSTHLEPANSEVSRLTTLSWNVIEGMHEHSTTHARKLQIACNRATIESICNKFA
jgi:hypothetical protein